MDNIVERNDFYLYKCSEEKRQETKERLTRISEMGMTEVGNAEFGVSGIMSGFYIERVWNMSDTDFDDYLQWAQGLINSKTINNVQSV
jgi:hypothetical protein